MEWWQKAVVVPVKRAWIVVAARLTTRRKKDGKIIIAAAVYIYYPFIHSLVHPSKDPNNAFFLCVCVCVCVCKCNNLSICIWPSTDACLDWFTDRFLLSGEQSVPGPEQSLPDIDISHLISSSIV